MLLYASDDDNYTIPSDNRELQLCLCVIFPVIYYTIPSDNRELQRYLIYGLRFYNYTIPSDNRELQHGFRLVTLFEIIPYQVITGNYNLPFDQTEQAPIIPYQVITGNYNWTKTLKTLNELYHTK